MTPIIDALNHRFDDNLECAGCGWSWFVHQDDPQPCERPMRAIENER